jgi:hypothetical protein
MSIVNTNAALINNAKNLFIQTSVVFLIAGEQRIVLIYYVRRIKRQIHGFARNSRARTFFLRKRLTETYFQVNLREENT